MVNEGAGGGRSAPKGMRQFVTRDRQSFRKVATSMLRIEIEPNNDAIVLNVSDGGLSFRALKPVTQSGIVHFSYFDNGQRLNASGELVWTDSAKLTGGLSLASLPRPSWERFRNWAEQSTSEESDDRDSGVPPRETVPGPGTRDAGLPPRETAPAPSAPLPNFSPLQSALPGFALPDEAQPPRYSWDREVHYPTPPSRFFSGFVTGVIVTAIALAVLFFFYGNSADALREQVRESAGLSPMPQVVPTTTPAPPGPPPVAATPQSALGQSASGSPPGTGASATPPATLPSEPSDNSVASAAAPTSAPKAPEAANQNPRASANPPRKATSGGEEDLTTAQRYLVDMPGPEGHQKAMQYLWSAVEKGNLKAEITLADLYARGEGVTKNCTQARVLLRAAAEKGSSEASNELARLIRTGCS